MILHELVATTTGALAAIFLDFEGETVELVCEHDLSDHDLRVIGAYQGVFLSRLRESCSKLKIGHPQRFRIDFDSGTGILSVDIKDGYYLVLLVDNQFNQIQGTTWHQMDACRDKILAEMY
jgi:hypothetical protein